MSLNTQEVLTFVKNFALKFQMNEADIINMWNSSTSLQLPVEIESTSSNPDSQTFKELDKLSKLQLTELCRLRGLKVSGNKPDLISRLGGGVAPVKPPKPKTQPKVQTKIQFQKPASLPVLQVIQTQVPNVVIRKNVYGNYEHPDTNLVFDCVTKNVIGLQLEGGEVRSLFDEDIELCNKYKFTYVLPMNLNKEKDEVKEHKVENENENEYEEEEEEEEEI